MVIGLVSNANLLGYDWLAQFGPWKGNKLYAIEFS